MTENPNDLTKIISLDRHYSQARRYNDLTNSPIAYASSYQDFHRMIGKAYHLFSQHCNKRKYLALRYLLIIVYSDNSKMFRNGLNL